MIATRRQLYRQREHGDFKDVWCTDDGTPGNTRVLQGIFVDGNGLKQRYSPIFVERQSIS